MTNFTRNCNLFLIVLLFASVCLSAQTSSIDITQPIITNKQSITENKWYVSLQYMGLTFHPGGGSFPESYPLKWDKKGYLVPQIGGVAQVDYQLNNRFFVRGAMAGYMDCAYLPSFFAHIGLRWEAIKWGKHTFNGGIGPTYLIRGNWFNKVERYRGGDFLDKRFTKNGLWQHRFFVFGGELEYLYRLNDKWQLQTSIIPGYPAVISMKVGARVKL
jgi:hypothetical protein